MLVISIRSIFSDDKGNGRATAMAFATMVSSFGTDAYGINPANFDYNKLKLKKSKKPTGQNQKNVSK